MVSLYACLDGVIQAVSAAQSYYVYYPVHHYILFEIKYNFLYLAFL